jgi:ABC-type phosphate transport system substrate-binding protein
MPGRPNQSADAARARSARRATAARTRLTRTAALLAVLAVVVGFTAFRNTSARATGPRTLTVTPATGLGNQVVLAHWTGFDPTVGFTDTVNLLQCKLNPKVVDADRNPATVDDCLTATPFPNAGNKVATGVTQADGTGSAFIEILPAAQQPLLNCSESNPCTLLAYENNGVPPPTDSLPTTAATTEIQFARSIDDCPPVTNFDVRAEGEASASTLIYNWAANVCTANPKLILDYTETSSVSGRQDFLNRLVDVGVTSMPPTSGELAASPGYPSYAFAPIDLTGVVVAYNMNDPTTGKRITDLTLSPRLLARVISDSGLTGNFSNPQSFWADPELNRLNPGRHWPAQSLSQPLLRAERNADAYFTTDWIAHDANAEAFLHGNDPDGVPVNDAWNGVSYPTDIFENLSTADGGYLPLQGERPVARKTFYAVKPAEVTPNDPKNIGFIGLVDLPTAERYDLPMAKLVNATGHAVAPDAAGIAAGYKAMTTNPDGVTKAPNFASSDPAAYPLVKVDYAMVPTKVANTTFEVNLKRFIAYIGGTGQSQLPVGYTPLPADLVAQDAAAAAKIVVVSPPPKTTTTTTTPPTTTPITATTAPPAGSLGAINGGSSNGFNTGSSTPSSTTVTTTSGSSKTAMPKPTKAAKLSHSKPVVDITNAGERFGLPVIAALALLAGLYPLSRRSRPLVQRGFAALRTRLRRADHAPPVSSAS